MIIHERTSVSLFISPFPIFLLYLSSLFPHFHLIPSPIFIYIGQVNWAVFCTYLQNLMYTRIKRIPRIYLFLPLLPTFSLFALTLSFSYLSHSPLFPCLRLRSYFYFEEYVLYEIEVSGTKCFCQTRCSTWRSYNEKMRRLEFEKHELSFIFRKIMMLMWSGNKSGLKNRIMTYLAKR